MKAWILDQDISIESLDGQAFAITPDNSVIPLETGILLFAGTSVLLSPDGNIFFNSADSPELNNSPERVNSHEQIDSQAPLFAHHSQSGSDQFGHVESIGERTELSDTITEIEEFFYFTSQYEAITRTHELAHLTPELKQSEQVSLSGIPEGTVFTDSSGKEYVVDLGGTLDISALDPTTLKMYPPADAADFKLSLDVIVRDHFQLDPLSSRSGSDTDNSVNLSLSQYADVVAGGDKVIITNLPTGAVLTDIFGYSVTVSEGGAAELSELELSYVTLVTSEPLTDGIHFDVIVIHSSVSTVLALESPATTVDLSEILPTAQTLLSGLPVGSEVFDANSQSIMAGSDGTADITNLDINTVVISPPAEVRYFEAVFTSTVSTPVSSENATGSDNTVVEKNAVAILHDALIIPDNLGVTDISASIPSSEGTGTLTLSQIPAGGYIIDGSEHYFSPDADGTLALSYPVAGHLLLSTPEHSQGVEVIAEFQHSELSDSWTTEITVDPKPFSSIDEFGSIDVTHLIPQTVLPAVVHFDLTSLTENEVIAEDLILFGLPEGTSIDDDRGHSLLVSENEQADVSGFNYGSIQLQLPADALNESLMVDIVVKTGSVSLGTEILQPGYGGDVDLSELFDDIDVSNLQLNATAVNMPNSSIANFDGFLGIVESEDSDDNLGSDLLSGSSDDYLVWESDEGGIDIPVLDPIGEPEAELTGEILNLSDLMTDEENHSLDQYLRFESDGNGNTIVEIGPNNEQAAGQKVILHGVDLSVYGDDSAIISKLIQDSNLDFDW